MPSFTPAELKRALLREGFEIYRTAGRFVLLADRVRENLIMDSGVALGEASDTPADPSSGGPASGASGGDGSDPTSDAKLVVRVTLKAQSSEFPNESADQLLARARQLTAPFSERGYQETDCQTVSIQDPSDPDQTIDTWHEVHWELTVPSLERAMEELRFAVGQEKTAGNQDD